MSDRKGFPPAARMNIELEWQVLGTMLLYNDAYHHFSHFLKPEHFGEPLHGRLFQCASDLILAGRPATPVTLKDSFPDVSVWPEKMTTPRYLAHLCGQALPLMSVEALAVQVRELWGLRQVGYIAQDLIEQPWMIGSPKKALDHAFTQFDQLRLELSTGERREALGMKEALLDLGAHMTKIYESEGEYGVTTGLTRLDRMLTGFKGGELIIVAGRPGMGKSTLLSSISHAVSKRGKGVGFFSLEMPTLQQTARILSDHFFGTSDPIPYIDMFNFEKIGDKLYNRVLDTADALEKLPLLIDDSSGITVAEVAVKIRAMRAKLARRGQTLNMVVLDYLNFLRSSDRYQGQKVQEVSEITTELKQLAKREDIPIILACQLNRKVEERENKRPVLADLRDSGAIEQDADTVIFCFREAYYLQQNPNLSDEDRIRLHDTFNKLELIIAKQRMGPTGTEIVYCDMPCAAIRNLDWQYGGQLV